MAFCRTVLPAGVNFEVPRDYAAFCKGHPVRVSATSSVSQEGVVLGWDSSTLTFASSTAVVEWDLLAVKGLVVTENELVSGAVAATVRVVFVGESGRLGTLPVFSANPANLAGFRQLVSALSGGGLPIRTVGSVKDLMNEAP